MPLILVSRQSPAVRCSSTSIFSAGFSELCFNAVRFLRFIIIILMDSTTQAVYVKKLQNTAVSRRVVTVDATGGEWYHAQGVDFAFYYAMPTWSEALKLKVGLAFQTALTLYPVIKEEVKKISGQPVLDGFYIQDIPTFTGAMNNIKGMAQTGSVQTRLTGENTAPYICADFFSNVLSSINSEVGPIQDYLVKSMGKVQSQSQAQKTETAGILIALISVVPGLDIVMTQFIHVVTSQQSQFNQLNCSSNVRVKYDFNVVQVKYIYAPS